MEIAISILILIALVLLSGFFSGGELALMSQDMIKLEARAAEGDRLARLQMTMRQRPNRTLGTILIGNNAVNVAMTTLATLLAVRYLAPLYGITNERASLVSGVFMTVIVVIFGELLPKTFAAMRGETMAAFVTIPMYVLDLLLTPANWMLEKLVMPVLKLFSGNSASDRIISREELIMGLIHASRSGALPDEELNVAQEALKLSTRDLADVMTPRVDIVALGEDCTVGEALSEMNNSGFSRLPVYRDDFDHIIGVLFLKDLVRVSLLAAEEGRDPEDKWADLPAKPYMRQTAHMPETKSIVEALAEMRHARLHFVVVVDEHGGTAGVSTMEDILEELVGEIHDETDEDMGADVIRREDDYVIVNGRARIEQLQELAGAELGDYESSTVGGLMMEMLGRTARVGDVIDLGCARITALKVLRTRIKLLRIDPAAPLGGGGAG